MIEIKHADKLLKEQLNIENEAYVCTDKSEVLGFVEYCCKDKDLYLIKVNADENMIADGLVRQTMSNALDNGQEFAKFSSDAQKRLYEIRIINKEDQNCIDILDFFMKINHI